MWELYDKLIYGLPESVYIKDVIIGPKWTAVRLSTGHVGIAMTTAVETVRRRVSDFTGMSLKAAAGYIKSWNFIEASVAMAAINAWYNTTERMEMLNSRQPDDRFCTFDYDLSDKNVVMVGRMRNRDSYLAEAKSLIILERDAKAGTYPDSACEYVIPESDLVIITGSALINKTMPRLLQLAGGGGSKVCTGGMANSDRADNARESSRIADSSRLDNACTGGIANSDSTSGDSMRPVIVTGPTVPMAEQLLPLGIERLAGLVVTDPERMLDFAERGISGPPYDMGERFYLDRKRFTGSR